jgi:hypothetical protein
MVFFPTKKSQAHDFHLSGQPVYQPQSPSPPHEIHHFKMSAPNPGRQSPPPEEQTGAQQQDAPSDGQGVNTETNNKEDSKSQLEVHLYDYFCSDLLMYERAFTDMFLIGTFFQPQGTS